MSISSGGTGHYCGMNAPKEGNDTYFALCGKRINKLRDENWTFYEQFVTCPKCNVELAKQNRID